MDISLHKVEIKYENDVVLARQRARQIASLIKFDSQDQVRIATAVSELARNAYQYAGGGTVEFVTKLGEPCKFIIRVTDNGPGICDLKLILNGEYVSKTGMGVGLVGAKRLMDDFHIQSTPAGTMVELTKYVPGKVILTPKSLSGIADILAKQEAQSPFEEIQRQNQELLAALDEVQRQQRLLTQLNQELEETNRGVLVLSGELEQRADYQRRSSELKTEFLSTTTHELRTPLNSIISISNILLSKLDGPLTAEQEKQVGYISSSARSLSELVNDVLDLAKVEAGKIVLRPREFEIAEMLRILKGLLKPLVDSTPTVTLVFEQVGDMTMFTDEGKVSQILRNFISNSLKYTQHGEVRVSAHRLDSDTIKLSVQDTGIGISPENHERIFEEFTQVEGEHQQKVRGTGLGLPLSRKLAHLLGGHVEIQSEPGKGSVFSLFLPVRYSGPEEAQYSEPYQRMAANKYDRVLMIDDNPTDRYVLKKLLERHSENIVEASSGAEGIELALSMNPSLIFLDLVMPGMSGAQVLKQLKDHDQTRNIPVVIHTSQVLSQQEEHSLLDLATAILSKDSGQKSRSRELQRVLNEILMAEQRERAHYVH